MAIRIRKVNNDLIALCAAETKKEKGDIYLDDNIHHALGIKFHNDFVSQGLIDTECKADEPTILKTMSEMNCKLQKELNDKDPLLDKMVETMETVINHTCSQCELISDCLRGAVHCEPIKDAEVILAEYKERK